MNFCRSCGVSIPPDQDFCSMCYGDIAYGTDGYYREMLERQAEEEAYNQYLEEKQMEDYLASLENLGE